MTLSGSSGDPFHDSAMCDVYALYNAVNGELDGGRLDLKRLDELSEAEREGLDIARLREVWEHTADCPTCTHIVRTLNSARGVLRASLDELSR